MSDHTLSENVARVFAISEKDKKALEEYKKAINKIDDFFEYANESKKDREFIHGVLDNLTGKLAKIYKK
jgi:hypothetical protein